VARGASAPGYERPKTSSELSPLSPNLLTLVGVAGKSLPCQLRTSRWNDLGLNPSVRLGSIFESMLLKGALELNKSALLKYVFRPMT
jgi:hypothetical protein